MQILLPPAAGRLLMDQDAPKNGAMFFELGSLGGQTHAGVLDFTAPAGTVVLPRKARPRRASAPAAHCEHQIGTLHSASGCSAQACVDRRQRALVSSQL